MTSNSKLKTKDPKRFWVPFLVIGTLMACLILFILLLVLVEWDAVRHVNKCVYEGIEYQWGDYRPDGECICLSTQTKHKWAWNCSK